MGKGSGKKSTPKKVATKGKTIKISKTPKKSGDSKFTKTIAVYGNQKDYFKLDQGYAKW